jgi:hypothetical protein
VRVGVELGQCDVLGVKGSGHPSMPVIQRGQQVPARAIGDA